MSKLCGCKKQFIHNILEDIMSGSYEGRGLMATRKLAVKNTLAIAKIVESDCVCEKVEEGYCCKGCGKNYATLGELVGELCNKSLEKQSQPPCDHKWEQMFWKEFIPESAGSPYRTHILPMWGCIEKCGLVTCVDPSRSAPSKNPNDK